MTPPSEPASNIAEYSVSELSAALKKTVETAYGWVRVRGELSGVKRAASGHLYMSLKDENAVLDGVCWRGVASRLNFRPEDGLEIVATGKLTTYPGRSKYQIVIEQMAPAGVGALMALLEERRKKLAAEGLFAEERKQPLPYLPTTIGVITSPTGAVIRDILHRLADRFPRHVLVWPVTVQGETAAGEIANAIAGFNGLEPGAAVPRPDLLIVARGGGSLEDLWAFNEEAVVRAVAASDIPVISAVGHETDTTLIDFAADRRAPTPTAAAEMAVPVQAELIATTADLGRRLVQARLRLTDRLRERLSGLARALPKPKDLLGLAAQRVDDLSDRLPRGLLAVAGLWRGRLDRQSGRLSASALAGSARLKRRELEEAERRLADAGTAALKDARQALAATTRVLESLSYARVLERGYAVVYSAEGRPVTGAADAAPGAAIDIEFTDGRVPAVIGSSGTPPAPKGRPKKAKKRDDRQGRLL